MLVSPPRVVNGVTWAFAPDRLNVSQACELSGYDRRFMFQVVEAGGVDPTLPGESRSGPCGSGWRFRLR